MSAHLDAVMRAYMEAGDRQLLKLYVKKPTAPVEPEVKQEDELSEEDLELALKTLGD